MSEEISGLIVSAQTEPYIMTAEYPEQPLRLAFMRGEPDFKELLRIAADGTAILNVQTPEEGKQLYQLLMKGFEAVGTVREIENVIARAAVEANDTERKG